MCIRDREGGIALCLKQLRLIGSGSGYLQGPLAGMYGYSVFVEAFKDGTFQILMEKEIIFL